MAKIMKQLVEAINASEKTRYQLWQETGISQANLSRVVNDGAGLSLENIDKLAQALGVEFKLVKPKGRSLK